MNVICACVQHPDLIEKRRKVFGERIGRYIHPEAAAAKKPPLDGRTVAADGATDGLRPRARATV